MDTHRSENDSRKRKKMMEMKKKMNNLTREQLKAAIEKKKICNAKAMTVVERLIEPEVDEIWLLENLFYINQSHYQDAVEERSIMKNCGYPLCDTLLDHIPKKQYHISTTQNKVFDITDRKNYCSNQCYKASIYLKEQIYSSPLWMRDCEDAVQYKLLSTVTEKTGSTGIEIDLGNISPVKSDESSEHKIDKNWENKELKTQQLEGNSSYYSVENADLNNRGEKQSDSKTKKQEVTDGNDKSVAISEYVVETNISKFEREEDGKPKGERRRIKMKVISKKKDRTLSVCDRVDEFLDTWFTADSLRFLYGDDKVKEILEEFGTPGERFGQLINTKDAFMYERYIEICRRLNWIELKEKLEEREEVMPTKPLPDYEALKEEAKQLEIKVRSFYLGDKRVHFPETFEENEIDKNNDKQSKSNEISVLPPILPLVDKHCVLATRRRIVLDKLSKTLPDIQSAVGLGHFNIRHEIQEFVHTLALNASNIILSPSEWNLVSIVLIKLFTLRNELLDYAFKTDLTQKRVINLLLSYKLDLDYLQRFVSKLTNVEQIIKNSQ